MKSFIKWLISLFNKKPVVSVPVEIPSTPTTTSDIKKISIIVGHGNGDPGATCWDGTHEYDYNSKVAEIVLSNVDSKLIRVFKRGSSGIAGVGILASAWSPDLTIELHLNAFNGEAEGCEVLVLDKDKESAHVAISFALAFCKKFDRISRRDRGINWIESSDRGYTNLKAVSLVKRSILVEPFFCDTKSEWIPVEVYAQFLVDWIEGL